MNKKKSILLSIGILLFLIIVLGYFLIIKNQQSMRSKYERERSTRIIMSIDLINVSSKLFYDDNKTYLGLENSLDVQQAKEKIIQNRGSDFIINISSDGESYCSSVFISGRDSFYCVDNNSKISGKFSISVPLCSTNYFSCEEVLKDETADWQTYRNEKYGFEFKYPTDWAAIESVSPGNPYLAYITLGSQETIQEGGFFSVSIRNQTEEEYLSSLTQEGFNIVSQEEITLLEEKATTYTLGKVSSPGITWKVLIIKKNGNLLEFSKGATLGYDEIFNQMLSTFRFIREDKTGITTYEKVKCQEIKNIECDRSFTDDYIIKYIKDFHSGGNYTEQEYKIVTFENQDSIIRGSVQTYGCSCCGGTIGSEANCEISEQYFNIPPDNSIVKVKFTIECSGDGKKTLEGQMGYNNELIDIDPVGPILASDIWGDESLYNCY